MWKRVLVSLVCATSMGAALADKVTPLEQRWLDGIAQVVGFARATQFPLDIVVQPQPTPGYPPLGIAFLDGRCQLVLSMRGNDRAQTLIDSIPPELLKPTLELVAAHELGHCERYLRGEFARTPSGFDTSADDAGREQAVRAEEAYADIVGLAWVHHRHPAHYAAVHQWLLAQRSADEVRGNDHDTTPWLLLAHDRSVLADPSIFSNAATLLARGLRAAVDRR